MKDENVVPTINPMKFNSSGSGKNDLTQYVKSEFFEQFCSTGEETIKHIGFSYYWTRSSYKLDFSYFKVFPLPSSKKKPAYQPFTILTI